MGVFLGLRFRSDVYCTQSNCAQYKIYWFTFNCARLNARALRPTMERGGPVRTARLKMAKKQAADAPLLLGNQICFAIYSAAHAFNRVYKPLLDRLGLTYPQYFVMLVLWERDGVPVKGIGERLFLDSGTLTPLLKRLETAGLIKRTRSTEDERQVLIALTSQGQALREKARTVPQAILATSACSISELSALKNELVALRDRLDAALAE